MSDRQKEDDKAEFRHKIIKTIVIVILFIIISGIWIYFKFFS